MRGLGQVRESVSCHVTRTAQYQLQPTWRSRGGPSSLLLGKSALGRGSVGGCCRAILSLDLLSLWVGGLG